jgi:monoterpene epsilon-lactone hydrolase
VPTAQLAEGTEFETVDADGVDCEWITATCKAPTPLSDACYFHVHGGGYYRGSSRVAAPVCSHIAGLAGIKCLSVNYRTAPEHKWPIGVDDTFTAYSWLVSPTGGNIDPSRVICGGDSAGGGLILALLLKLRDTDPSKLPAGATPLSPWTDLTQSSETFVTNADSGVSNCDKVRAFSWPSLQCMSRANCAGHSHTLTVRRLGG